MVVDEQITERKYFGSSNRHIWPYSSLPWENVRVGSRRQFQQLILTPPTGICRRLRPRPLGGWNEYNRDSLGSLACQISPQSTFHTKHTAFFGFERVPSAPWRIYSRMDPSSHPRMPKPRRRSHELLVSRLPLEHQSAFQPPLVFFANSFC